MRTPTQQPLDIVCQVVDTGGMSTTETTKTATWTRLRDGHWGLRTEQTISIDEQVTMVARDGREQTVTVGPIVFTDGTVTLAEIDPEHSAPAWHAKYGCGGPTGSDREGCRTAGGCCDLCRDSEKGPGFRVRIPRAATAKTTPVATTSRGDATRARIAAWLAKQRETMTVAEIAAHVGVSSDAVKNASKARKLTRTQTAAFEKAMA